MFQVFLFLLKHVWIFPCAPKILLLSCTSVGNFLFRGKYDLRIVLTVWNIFLKWFLICKMFDSRTIRYFFLSQKLKWNVNKRKVEFQIKFSSHDLKVCETSTCKEWFHLVYGNTFLLIWNYYLFYKHCFIRPFCLMKRPLSGSSSLGTAWSFS